MKILPPLMGRILIASVFIATGGTSLLFGYAFIRNGGAFGIGMILFGLCLVVFAPVFLWRGWRLGAEIQQGSLVVRGYFRRDDIIIPLSGLLQVRRGIGDDSTVLEFLDRQFILDDTYFADSKARDSMFKSLQSYAKEGLA